MPQSRSSQKPRGEWQNPVHADANMRKQNEKELKGQVLLNVTYNRDDWKNSNMEALPRERKLLEDDRPQTTQTGPKSILRASETRNSEKEPTSPMSQLKGGPHMPALRKSLQLSPNLRVSKTSSMSHQEDLEGSVEAWKLHEDKRKANQALRKELAHVSRLRDLYKLHGKDEGIWEFEQRYFPGIANEIKGIRFRPGTTAEDGSAEGGGRAAAKTSEPERVSTSKLSESRSRVGTAAYHRAGTRDGSRAASTRPATSVLGDLEVTGESSGQDADARARTGKSGRMPTATAKSRPSTRKPGTGLKIEEESGVVPPSPFGPKHLAQLLGTHSRPTTMRRTIERRQPQAEMHLLWLTKRTDESFNPDAEKEKETKVNPETQARRENDRKNRQLIKLMRKQIQARMTDTANLPGKLWKYFKNADDDDSGRIEYAEYVKVMTQMGLGTDQLGETNLGTLFRLADKDRNGNIDFNEFLRTVVGNMVSL